VNEDELPDKYYALALLHSIGGMTFDALKRVSFSIPAMDRRGVPEQVNYFDALRLDRRCSRDLSFRTHAAGPCMYSAELLSFGTGMLRARNDSPNDAIHRYLWGQFGRLQSRHEQVFARIVALHQVSGQKAGELAKESFDSTNVIYGDAYGELEQVWSRRADTTFLDQIAKSLQPMRRRSEVMAFLHPPLNPLDVLGLHLRRQAVWRTPPVGGRSLLHRLEYILDRTVVDRAPATLHSPRAIPQPTQQRRGANRDQGPWRKDSSGYDGWLT